MTSTSQSASDTDFTFTIDGKEQTSESSFPVINPATGQPCASCPDASRDQLDSAVAAARKAFQLWKTLPDAERRELIRVFSEKLNAEVDAIAPILTLEQGKPLEQARREVLGNRRKDASVGFNRAAKSGAARGRAISSHTPLLSSTVPTIPASAFRVRSGRKMCGGVKSWLADSR